MRKGLVVIALVYPENSMADLCIQILPHKAVGLDLDSVRAACEDLAADRDLIQKFAVVDGTDGHYYMNLMFATDRPQELWTLLEQRLYGPEFGTQLRGCSMAMCEGKHGWDDYLLLYHFDPAVPCDAFAQD